MSVCVATSPCLVHCSEARNHGRKDVGLPSRLASFTDDHSLSNRKRPTWWQPKQVKGTIRTSPALRLSGLALHA